jgi:3-methyladenine DNA glycosylase AlkD
MLKHLQKETIKLADKKRAALLQRYFKTGKGEYAEGDIFLGLNLIQVRELAKKYKDMPFKEISELINSKYHEERVITLVILVNLYKKGDETMRLKIFNFYLKNTKGINNWDLVDISAGKIVGEYLAGKDRIFTKDLVFLKHLAASKNVWERRIAVISTSAFINRGEFGPTLEISKMLLSDKHDLIHKAVGWMLREIGKKDEKVLCNFLDKYKSVLPRTELRYAIEKFPQEKRLRYLSKS